MDGAKPHRDDIKNPSDPVIPAVRHAVTRFAYAASDSAVGGLLVGNGAIRVPWRGVVDVESTHANGKLRV